MWIERIIKTDKIVKSYTDSFHVNITVLSMNLDFIIVIIQNPFRHEDKIDDKTRYMAFDDGGIATQDMLIHYIDRIALPHNCKYT